LSLTSNTTDGKKRSASEGCRCGPTGGGILILTAGGACGGGQRGRKSSELKLYVSIFSSTGSDGEVPRAGRLRWPMGSSAELGSPRFWPTCGVAAWDDSWEDRMPSLVDIGNPTKHDLHKNFEGALYVQYPCILQSWLTNYIKNDKIK
jgi:hypothetical protein